MPTKGDWLVIAAVCLLALLPLLFLFGETGRTAAVRVDGQLVMRISLEEDGEYPIDTAYGHNLLAVEGGAIRVREADCPDGTCLREGAVSRAGRTLACLPHRLSVTIEGEGEYDAVAR